MSRAFSGSSDPDTEQSLATPESPVYNNIPAFTLAAWVKPAGPGGNNFGTLFTVDPANSYAIWFGFAGDGSLGLEAEVLMTVSHAQYNTVAALTPGVWQHVAMTFESLGDLTPHVYINGVEDTGGTSAPGVGLIDDNSGGGWYIGGDTFGDGWDGLIAESVIYGSALNAGEIAALAASSTGATGNPVGYWHLCGTASPEPDSSGNDDPGTLSAVPPVNGNANSPGYSACGGSPPETVTFTELGGSPAGDVPFTALGNQL